MSEWSTIRRGPLGVGLGAGTLALLGLLACGSGRSDPVTLRSGDVELRVAVEPAAPRVGENRIWVELHDADGDPVEDAEVAVRVHMVAMGAMPAMGGAARVVHAGGNRWRADFGLEMGGSWQVEVRTARPSGEVARAEGSLTVGSPGLRLAAPGGAAAGGPAGHGATPPRAAGEGAPGEFVFDPGRLQQIGVRSEPAERAPLAAVIRSVGRVAYDERALQDVVLRVAGFAGELEADALGDPVTRGQVLFTFYSPELYAAQEEYLQALRSQVAARASGAPERADYLVRSARRRLQLWDVAPSEIERIARRGRPLEYLPVRSPADGFVIEKNLVAGAAIEPGARLYRIAPLDRVWVEAHLYEAELERVEVGESVRVTLPYLPDRSYEGRVAFVYPFLDGATRTLRVRVVLDNEGLVLRPDMYANVELRRDLGPRLTVPEQAVLPAGERSFVFLDLGEGRLRPRQVETGVRSDGRVEITRGLEEGERVVVSGTFLVASESRLRAALEQW